jgi:hypothetical protein
LPPATGAAIGFARSSAGTSIVAGSPLLFTLGSIFFLLKHLQKAKNAHGLATQAMLKL